MFTGVTQVRASSAAWVVRIPPLAVGHHEVILSDDVLGDPYTATFHISVHPAHR
jgi:hypothetical protein